MSIHRVRCILDVRHDTNMAETLSKSLNPLYVVVLVLGFIEYKLVDLYPHLSESWEKIGAFCVLLGLPTAVVITFLYIWVKRPGFLYKPSEFGTDGHTPIKLQFYDCWPPRPGSGVEIETSIGELYLKVKLLEDKLTEINRNA